MQKNKTDNEMARPVLLKLINYGKLPLIKSLRTEMNQLYPEKKLYNEYWIYKKEFKDIQLMKSNVE